MGYTTYNVGFQTLSGAEDETQLDARDMADLFNLIDSLKSELELALVLYIEEDKYEEE